MKHNQLLNYSGPNGAGYVYYSGTIDYTKDDNSVYSVPEVQRGYVSNLGLPENYYNRSNTYGTGQAAYRRLYNNTNYFSPDYYEDFGHAAIDEAGYYKDSTAINRSKFVYSVALSAEDKGQETLKGVASNASEPYYIETNKPAELESIFKEIAANILRSVKSSSVADPMGSGFQIMGNATNVVTEPASPAATVDTDGTIHWAPGDLSLPIAPGSDVKYAQISYRVEINDDILDTTPASGDKYFTNGNAVFKFTDINGDDATAAFPAPTVNPLLYLLRKVVKNVKGEDVTATCGREFNVNVQQHNPPPGQSYNKDYTIKTAVHNSTRLLTTLRNQAYYLVTESSEHAPYYTTKYFVSQGQDYTDEHERPTRIFQVWDTNQADVYVTIENIERPAKLTIEKVLDQRYTRSRAAGNARFEFTITGPNNYSKTVYLPDNTSSTPWKKELTGLSWGAYTVTEKENPLYDTTYSVNGSALPAGSSSASVSLGAEAQSLEATITVTNKQKEPFKVTAQKTWTDNNPNEIDTWLTLFRKDPDDNSIIKISTRKLLAGTAVMIWSQADNDLDPLKLIRYKAANGHAYIYYVTETDSSGNAAAPAGYFKTEKDLTVKNTPIPPLTIEGTKTLTGRALKNTDKFTFELYNADDEGNIVPNGAAPVKTVQNSGADFSFVLDNQVITKLGTSYFLIKEKAGSLAGVTYSTKSFLLQVETKMNAQNTGVIHVTTIRDLSLPASSGNVVQNIEFVNAYHASGTWKPYAKKSLTGRTLAAGDFEFVLKKGDDTLQIKENASEAAGGTVTFDAISFDETMVGTHTYTLRERVKGTPETGMTYDSAVYTITVTVKDNGDGTLTVTSDKAGANAPLVFNNTYNASGSWTPLVKKVLSGGGRKLGDKEFSFGLYDAEGNLLKTAQNDTEGVVRFPAIAYTQANTGSTFTYTIKEIIPADTEDNMVYDTKVYTAEVTVKDGGGGTLDLDVVYKLGNVEFTGTPEFTNSYTASGSWQAELKKVLTGRDLTAGAFSFVLRKGTEQVATGTNDADGKIQFTAINYTQADINKDYEYTAYEVVPNPAEADMIYDPTGIKIKVHVSDAGNGKLTVNATYPSDKTFNNKYSADGTWTPAVKKYLQAGSRLLKANEFTFTLSKEGAATPLQTKKNLADGSIPFETIQYSQDDINKTYVYLIKEVVPSADGNGMVYSRNTIRVTVAITDKGGGELSVTSTYKKVDAEGQEQSYPTTFINTYTAAGNWLPEAKKTLTAGQRKLQAGEFTFVLLKDGTEVQRVSNKADGTIPFTAETFDQDDIGKTFTYKVRELIPSSAQGGMTYDNTIYEVKVKVEDNGDGTLKTTVNYGEMSSETFAFNNTYKAKGSWQALAQKVLSGRTLKAEEFSFTLTKDGETEALRTAKNTLSGAVKFAPIEYDQNDINKTYVYWIKEVKPEPAEEGMTYAANKVKVTVKVEDNKNGTLKVTATYGSEAKFNNVYKAKGSWLPDVSKNLKGRTLANEEFTFDLYQGSRLLQSVKNDAAGKVNFTKLNYSEKDINKTYTYTIKEIKPADPEEGMAYDTAARTVKVTITDAGNGALNVAADYGQDLNKIVFKNVYTAKGKWSPEVRKVLSGRALKNEEFTFELIDPTENVPVATASNSQDGKVVFEGQTFTQDAIGQSFTYEIKELVPTPAENGMTYDQTVKTVTVWVSDGGNGTLLFRTEYGDDQTAAVFKNSYKAKGVFKPQIFKDLQGRTLKKDDFTFTLSDGQKVLQTVKNAAPGADGKAAVPFEPIAYNESMIGRKIAYYVREVQGSEGGMTYDTKTVKVVVSIEDAGNGRLKVTADYGQAATSATFNNSYKADGTWTPRAAKFLNAGGRALKAGEFTFAIKVKGAQEPFETVTNKKDGSVAFTPITYGQGDINKKFVYEIYEVAPAEPEAGMTYDLTPVEVTVTVKDLGGGKLEAQQKIAEGQDLTFENVYAAEGDIQLSVNKLLSAGGRALGAGEFEYWLLEPGSDLPIDIAANKADGQVVFKKLSFNQSDIGKTYKYQIREYVPGEGEPGYEAGMTYDTKTVVVKVTIADAGNGKLSITADYGNGASSADFNNSYKASGSWNPKFLKVLNGRPLEDGEFSFVIMQGNAVVETAVNKKDGLIVFDPIAYDQDDIGQTYYYSIKEQIPTPGENGMTYANNVIFATVKVSDAGNGKLNVLASYTDAQQQIVEKPVFVNTYKAAGSWTPEGHKYLQGRPLRNEEFTFYMIRTDHSVNQLIQYVKNDANGKIKFEPVNYTQDDIGKTYEYKVFEGIPDTPEIGMDYATGTKVFVITVTVSDQGNGKLKVDVKYSAPIAFNNSYHAEGSWKPEVNKVLQGRTLKDGEFTFTLSKDGTVLQTKQNDAAGLISFDEVKFTQADIGKNYTYKIKEVKPNTPEGGMSYEADEITWNVSVADGRNGKLLISASVGEGIQYFLNTYEAKAQWVPEASKVLAGRALKADEFNFEMKEGGTVIGTAKNRADGKVLFPPIAYDQDDIGKTFNYTINEVKPTDPENGMTYAANVSNIEVKVEDAGNGLLKLTTTYKTPALFKNVYKAAGSWKPEAQKNMTGRALRGMDFYFELREGTTIITTAPNAADGSITFPTINYSEADIGKTFKYTIREEKPATAEAGVSYDAKVVEIEVKVTDGGNGVLKTDVNYKQPAVFENSYKASGEWVPYTEKRLDGRPIKEGEFTFTLSRNGTVLATAKNDKNGDVIFAKQVFDEKDIGKEYIYEIKEVKPAVPELGMTYDTAVVTWRVKISDQGNGKLKVAYGIGKGNEYFLNVYKAGGSWVPAATKKLAGRALKDGEFSFTLSQNGTVLQTKQNKADGSITFDKISYTQADIGKTFKYTINEVKPAAAEAGMSYDAKTVEIEVKVTDGGNGVLKTDVNYKQPAVFENSYKASGEWVPYTEKRLDGRQIKEGEFTFTLSRNGTVLATAKNDKNGDVIFAKQVFDEKDIGKEYVYEIKEEKPAAPELGMAYDTAVVTWRVKISDQGNGKLKVAYGIGKGNEYFLNVYKAGGDWVPAVTKKLAGRALKDGEFSFTLSQNGTVLQTKQNKADGSIAFDKITFTQADIGKTYTYVLKEVVPATGEKGVTYDTQEIVAVVKVLDQGNGELATQTTYKDGKQSFDNSFASEKIDLTVKKVWAKAPSKHPDIEVQLYRDGAAFGPAVKLSGTDTYTWKGLDKYDTSGKDYKYTVKEVKVPKGYAVSYSADTFTITNTYVEVPKTGENPTTLWGMGLGTLGLAVLAYVIKRKFEEERNK